MAAFKVAIFAYLFIWLGFFVPLVEGMRIYHRQAMVNDLQHLVNHASTSGGESLDPSTLQESLPHGPLYRVARYLMQISNNNVGTAQQELSQAMRIDLGQRSLAESSHRSPDVGIIAFVALIAMGISAALLWCCCRQQQRDPRPLRDPIEMSNTLNRLRQIELPASVAPRRPIMIIPTPRALGGVSGRSHLISLAQVAETTKRAHELGRTQFQPAPPPVPSEDKTENEQVENKKHEKEEDRCVICFEPLGRKGNNYIKCCKKPMHPKCAVRWWKQQALNPNPLFKCPLCQRDIEQISV